MNEVRKIGLKNAVIGCGLWLILVYVSKTFLDMEPNSGGSVALMSAMMFKTAEEAFAKGREAEGDENQSLVPENKMVV